MDDLIVQIQERTNLSRDKVIEVVTMVTDFMKERMPADVVETVTEYLSGAGEKTVTVVGSATDMASGVARSAAGMASEATEKVVGTASTAFSTATGAVSGAVSSDDEES